jgi:hypothetical protein
MTITHDLFQFSEAEMKDTTCLLCIFGAPELALDSGDTKFAGPVTQYHRESYRPEMDQVAVPLPQVFTP